VKNQVSPMRVKQLVCLSVGAWLTVAPAAMTQGTPEASCNAGTDPVVLCSSQLAFDAGPSLRDDPGGRPLLISLRLRKERDKDADGVTDGQDACPDTPVQATVDTRGCPTDRDQDGVFDGIDQCANTARGAQVDTAGCPRDSDGDGLLDGLDQCPDTDPRALVNEDGCPYDSDGDGLLDGIDQCPATQMGAVVDERGCRVDTDGDGVADGLDQCPDTTLEDETDESGCSRAQRGEFALPTIRFGLGILISLTALAGCAQPRVEATTESRIIGRAIGIASRSRSSRMTSTMRTRSHHRRRFL